MKTRSGHIGSWPVILVALLGLAAYTLPWLVNPGTALTMGADDLAEWSTLHPVVQSETPALLSALLLRLPLICLAVIISFLSLQRGSWAIWTRLLVVLSIVLFIMPPLEFFVTARSDPNYRQQFALGLAAMLLSAVGFSYRAVMFRKPIIVVAALVGIVSTMFGLQRAYDLMYGFSLPLQIGFGSIGTLLIFVSISWFVSRQ